jgi:hypothetical protein
MCRLRSARLHVTVASPVTDTRPLLSSSQLWCTITSCSSLLSTAITCVPDSSCPRYTQLPSRAPYSIVSVARSSVISAHGSCDSTKLRICCAASSTASPIVKSVLISTLAAVNASACEATED